MNRNSSHGKRECATVTILMTSCDAKKPFLILKYGFPLIILGVISVCTHTALINTQTLRLMQIDDDIININKSEIPCRRHQVPEVHTHNKPNHQRHNQKNIKKEEKDDGRKYTQDIQFS